MYFFDGDRVIAASEAVTLAVELVYLRWHGHAAGKAAIEERRRLEEAGWAVSPCAARVQCSALQGDCRACAAELGLA